MAYDNRITGTDTLITFTPDGGSPLSLEVDFTSFSFDRSRDTVDATAGNEKERMPKATIEGMDWTLNLYDVETSLKAQLLPGVVGVLNVKPEGAGVGLEEFELNVVLTGYSEDFPFDNLLEIEITGMRIGPMVKEFGTSQVA